MPRQRLHRSSCTTAHRAEAAAAGGVPVRGLTGFHRSASVCSASVRKHRTGRLSCAAAYSAGIASAGCA
jgi:hypothetical protein